MGVEYLKKEMVGEEVSTQMWLLFCSWKEHGASAPGPGWYGNPGGKKNLLSKEIFPSIIAQTLSIISQRQFPFLTLWPTTLVALEKIISPWTSIYSNQSKRLDSLQCFHSSDFCVLIFIQNTLILYLFMDIWVPDPHLWSLPLQESPQGPVLLSQSQEQTSVPYIPETMGQQLMVSFSGEPYGSSAMPSMWVGQGIWNLLCLGISNLVLSAMGDSIRRMTLGRRR